MAEESAERPRSTLARAVRIGLVLMALAVGGFALAALFYGDQQDLPIMYDGFD